MSKIIEAEYLADERVLKLAQPVEGLADHERVHVVIEQHPPVDRSDWPKLDDEAGRELARAVRDSFGRDKIAI